MNKHAIPPLIVPADLDLGDIQNIKVGDAVAVIHTHTGKREISPEVRTVESISPAGLVKGKQFGFFLKNNGAAYYFMQYGVFFYSVNPVHIEEARALAIKLAREKEIADAERARRLALAKPVGEFLGDGEMEDGSTGETYISTTVARTLVEHLTDEQIRTLAGWFGVKVSTEKS